jgi:alcohol dehydrogenase (cytochrome c)
MTMRIGRGLVWAAFAGWAIVVAHTTAGGVLFTGDGSGNFVAFDAAKGKPLWHSRIGNISNAPQTHLLDGRQHVLVAVGDMLYDFVLY